MYISSIASFLVWGGGGGKTPKCTDRKKNSCTCKLYERASASETYIFSGLKIHTYTINAVSFYYTYGMVL